MSEKDVLQESLELNRIQAELLKERSKDKRTPWIVCGAIVAAVAISAVIIVGMLLNFFSQYEFYYEEITVTQDSADGGGNNVYFPGENATYNEGDVIDGAASDPA